MAFFDLPLDQLQSSRLTVVRPDDLEQFWTATLDAELSRPLDARIEQLETPLRTLDVYDVSWVGYGGQRVQAWLRLPVGATGPLPTVLQYSGYSGGRGYPFVDSVYASAGYAHFILESRAQGWRTPSLTSTTPDLDATAGDMHAPGVMTLGIQDPARYYYRRLYVDAVRMLQLSAHDLAGLDDAPVVEAGEGEQVSVQLHVDLGRLPRFERHLGVRDQLLARSYDGGDRVGGIHLDDLSASALASVRHRHAQPYGARDVGLGRVEAKP